MRRITLALLMIAVASTEIVATLTASGSRMFIDLNGEAFFQKKSAHGAHNIVIFRRLWNISGKNVQPIYQQCLFYGFHYTVNFSQSS